MTLEEFKYCMEVQVAERLNLFAKTRGYDDIVAACSYVNSSVTTYATEAQYCITARDDTWNALFSIITECENNVRPIPLSYEEIESELPTLTWPT